MGDLGALKYIPAIACGAVLLIAYVVYVIVGKIKDKKKKKEIEDIKKVDEETIEFDNEKVNEEIS